jgi:hypothetical protein
LLRRRQIRRLAEAARLTFAGMILEALRFPR